MTTIINANNSGVSVTIDTSGVFQLQTANTAALTIGTDQNANFSSTGAIIVPNGTTAQRPSTAVNGMFRYNSNVAKFEAYSNGSWVTISSV